MRISLALAFLSFSTPLLAQANVCPGGQPAVVRISKIIPGGTMAGFKAAAHDHAAWYKSHGIATTQFLAPVLVYSPASKSVVESQNEAMTVRIGAVEVSRDKQDAGWVAFVAKYRANSTITSETRVCFPKPLP